MCGEQVEEMLMYIEVAHILSVHITVMYMIEIHHLEVKVGLV